MSALFARAANIVLSALASISAAAGCGNDTPPPPRPGPGMVLNNPTNTATAPSQGPEYAPNQPYQQPRLSSGLSAATPPPAAKEKQDEPAEEKKARDYSAELSEQLKSTVSCLTGNKGTALTISVSAQVMPSGSITRADAQGAGLTPVELSCIQKLVGALHLAGPIEGAPRSVSAHLTLQAQATKQAPQQKEADDKDDNDGDENPHDSKLKEVNNDPAEVRVHEEPVREQPEAPEAREEPPHDDKSAE